jgi:hypothetical protein
MLLSKKLKSLLRQKICIHKKIFSTEFSTWIFYNQFNFERNFYGVDWKIFDQSSEGFSNYFLCIQYSGTSWLFNECIQ